MNDAAYQTVTSAATGCGVRRLPIGFLRVTGRDRAKYLQGQISNDVADAGPGDCIEACLLNNTGHLLAYLSVYVRENDILLGTDSARVATLRHTLEKYIVRERVEIEPTPQQLVTVQGSGASAFLSEASASFAGVSESVATFPRLRLTSSEGFDVVCPPEVAERLLAAIDVNRQAFEIDDDTAQLLRIESGQPAWGAELDESVIPLEAGLERAISYSKGCYMGQEIIARIHSRGHTNRTLCGLKSGSPVKPATTLQAMDGEKEGQDVGRITSAAQSPRFGWIGLGYIRNEYSHAGTILQTENGPVRVSSLPFTHEP